MRARIQIIATAALVAASFPLAAQQPAAAPPPPPAFAESNLTPAGVRLMAGGCATCHGTDGRTAKESSVAALAGRPREEIVQLMAQFKEGKRPATIMHQIAKGYSDAEVAALAEFFAKQPR